MAIKKKDSKLDEKIKAIKVNKGDKITLSKSNKIIGRR